MKPDRHLPDPTAPLPFDGSLLVARHAPGTANRHQKSQTNRLGQVSRQLRSWANRFSLPLQHVDRAAYFTVVSTPLGLPFEQVAALAETIFWIYVFDDFLDRRTATEGSRLQVDRDLGRIVAPLSPGLSRLAEGTRRRHYHPATSSLLDELSWVVGSAGSRGHPPDREHEALTLGIRDALGSLLAHLDCCWWDLATQAETRQFRRSLVERQVARCMVSMRREFAWNVQLASHLEKPTYAMYLMTGSVSIGMHAVAAVVASYDSGPERAWRKSWAAIDTAGRIIRLANDLATYPRELAEGKLSSVSLILDELDHSQGRRDLESAVAVIRQSLSQLTGFFGYVSRPPEEFAVLTFYLQHIVAFALSAYRQEEEKDTSAAQPGQRGQEGEREATEPMS